MLLQLAKCHRRILNNLWGKYVFRFNRFLLEITNNVKTSLCYFNLKPLKQNNIWPIDYLFLIIKRYICNWIRNLPFASNQYRWYLLGTLPSGYWITSESFLQFWSEASQPPFRGWFATPRISPLVGRLRFYSFSSAPFGHPLDPYRSWACPLVECGSSIEASAAYVEQYSFSPPTLCRYVSVSSMVDREKGEEWLILLSYLRYSVSFANISCFGFLCNSLVMIRQWVSPSNKLVRNSSWKLLSVNREILVINYHISIKLLGFLPLSWVYRA